jgi:lysophospholipase L1-like esterase
VAFQLRLWQTIVRSDLLAPLVNHLLCFGDSFTWDYAPGTGERFPPDVRWPGVLQARLGGGVRVIEEGLNGRTTVHEDPDRDGRNARRYLGPLLESHAPVDLPIVMPGTNDLMPCYASSAADAAAGAGVLLDIAAAGGCGRGATAPAMLLVAPPRIAATEQALALGYAGAAGKSAGFSEHFRLQARAHGCTFLDAAAIVSPSGNDGVHLDALAHARFGQAMAACVKNLF